jgi:hypothetical protein
VATLAKAEADMRKLIAAGDDKLHVLKEMLELRRLVAKLQDTDARRMNTMERYEVELRRLKDRMCVDDSFGLRTTSVPWAPDVGLGDFGQAAYIGQPPAAAQLLTAAPQADYDGSCGRLLRATAFAAGAIGSYALLRDAAAAAAAAASGTRFQRKSARRGSTCSSGRQRSLTSCRSSRSR